MFKRTTINLNKNTFLNQYIWDVMFRMIPSLPPPRENVSPWFLRNGWKPASCGIYIESSKCWLNPSSNWGWGLSPDIFVFVFTFVFVLIIIHLKFIQYKYYPVYCYLLHIICILYTYLYYTIYYNIYYILFYFVL